MHGEEQRKQQKEAEDRPMVLGYHAPPPTQEMSLFALVLIWALVYGIATLIFSLGPPLPLVLGWLLATPIALVAWSGWEGFGWLGSLTFLGLFVGNSLIYGLVIALIIHWLKRRRMHRM